VEQFLQAKEWMAGSLKYSGLDDSGSGQWSSSYRQKNGWQEA
jgi:hypothetical protein